MERRKKIMENDKIVEAQMKMEQAELIQVNEEHSVTNLMEQLSILDSYIYTAKKQVHRLSIKDATSVAYGFAVGLLETLIGFRVALLGEYCGMMLSNVNSEQIGVILEHLKKQTQKGK